MPKFFPAVDSNQYSKPYRRLEKKIFVIRPSRLVDIKRLERNVERIQEMYDLGREDAAKSLEAVEEYLSAANKGL